MKAQKKAEPGHLSAYGPIYAVQTEQSKRAMSRATRTRYAMAKIKPVTLDWKRGEK